ncbi:MAG: GTP-binding protein [Betaproteobacteria bacterium]|nr:GTP-binding protein [Betaproteobacteria bacterium]
MTPTSPERTPVSIITGFLGSGKTTLLNRLLQHPGMADTAVIINEFGETGLDHLLIAAPSENTVLLSSGCLCCTVRGDLVATLADLYARRRDGAIPHFGRVLIETTGLADPVPILQTVMTDPELVPAFRLDAVVTLVDGVNGAAQLVEQAESVKQAAVADCLLITKADLAPPGMLEALRQRLGTISPVARLFVVVHGEIAPESLFGAGLDDVADRGDVRRWLREDALAAGAGHDDHRHGQGEDEGAPNAGRHDHHIRAFCVYYDKPVSATGLAVWLDTLAALRGANLLRVKGLLNVGGEPVAVHAVQTLVHEPKPLPGWPDDDRRSRLVFITRDMARAEVERTLGALALPDAPRGRGCTIDPNAYAQFVEAMKTFR